MKEASMSPGEQYKFSLRDLFDYLQCKPIGLSSQYVL